MTVWLTSDTHFNHEGAIRHNNRPWSDVYKMNAGLIENYNSLVSPGDEVYHLGDFGFINQYGEDLEAIFSKLNGHKHLIVGNHDEQNKAILKFKWASVSHYKLLKVGKSATGIRAVLMHYPLETWYHPERYIMLHGHCHGNLKRVIPRRHDVGVDPNGYHPINLENIHSTLMTQEFIPQDHHGE